MKALKYSLAILVILVLNLIAVPVARAMTGYELGVADSSSNQYREVVFLGGSPQVFDGTVKVSSKTKGNLEQTTLTYKLTGTAKGDSLTRTVKLESQIDTSRNQEVYTTRMTGLTESIQVGGQKFKLKKDGGMFFSASKVVDHRPIIDFTSENWYLKKAYDLGKDGATVTVEQSGTSDGYDNAWGKGSTATISTHICGYSSDQTDPDWEASIDSVTNDSFTRDLEYLPSQPQLISYSGGFLEQSTIQETLKYDYNLPTPDTTGTTMDNDDRNRGSDTMSLTTPPTQKRLFIKEFKDVNGHWAQRPIEEMCGMGVFDNNGNIFGPGVPALRKDLARGIAVLCDLVKAVPVKAGTANKQPAAETLKFMDVKQDDPNYQYIAEVYRRGIITGTSDYLFGPNEQLSRAEAAHALITALGLTRLAPSGQYTTPFLDDGSIPLWAKDSVYVANEIGLIRGDSGSFRPNDIMTRAELASLLDGLRVYLNRDFQRDYRERVYTFK
jgi:hypothetical protein